MGSTHRYESLLHWAGSTGAGYEHYDRTHEVRCAPATSTLALSSDPAFRGDPRSLNPEQLLLAAAASCQLLSFLAVAARARIDVVSYVDRGEAEMPERSKAMAIESIVLRPGITIVEGPSLAKVQRLVEIAHRECFIANSLRIEPRVEPTITFVPAQGGDGEPA